MGKSQVCFIWCQLQQLHCGSTFNVAHSHGWQDSDSSCAGTTPNLLVRCFCFPPCRFPYNSYTYHSMVAWLQEKILKKGERESCKFQNLGQTAVIASLLPSSIDHDHPGTRYKDTDSHLDEREVNYFAAILYPT